MEKRGGARNGAGRRHEHIENVLVDYVNWYGDNDCIVVGPYLNRDGQANKATMGRAGAISRNLISEGAKKVSIVKRRCCILSENILIEEVSQGTRPDDWQYDDEMRHAVNYFRKLEEEKQSWNTL